MAHNELSDVILEVEDLSVGFGDSDDAPRALSGVTFQIHRDEIIGLVGETGAGKSVLARALIDLIPYPGRIVTGDIRLNGQSILHLNPSRKREIRGGKVALIGTNPKALLNPVEHVGTQIAEVLRAHSKVSKAHAKRAATTLLSELGIRAPADVAKSHPHQLSGGMAQRVVIAMALIASPDLLLADDATLGLDATVQVQVLDMLLEQSRKRGMAILLITHDLAIVAKYCRRVMIMHKGKVIEISPVDQFFTNPEKEYSRELVAVAESAVHVEETFEGS
jgi:ABC-type dipeptide/oligopeptide/nickel transport system ATPase component